MRNFGFAFRFDNFPQNLNTLSRLWLMISHYLSRPYSGTRPILLLSCHFLGQRALLFWLFTAISDSVFGMQSLDGSRNDVFLSHLRRMSCLVGRPRGTKTSPSLRDVLPRGRAEERALIRLPSVNSAGRSHWRYRPRRPC